MSPFALFVTYNAQLDAIGTLVTAAATIVLAALTALLWIETRRMREQTHSASIVVSLEPHPRQPIYFNLVIENTGNAVAYDIRLTLDREVMIQGERAPFRLNDFHIFESPISALKSGQRIENFVGRWYEGFPVFDVAAQWRDEGKRPRTQHYPLDIGFYKNNRKLNDDPLRQIAESQKKIVQLLGVIVAAGGAGTVVRIPPRKSQPNDPA